MPLLITLLALASLATADSGQHHAQECHAAVDRAIEHAPGPPCSPSEQDCEVLKGSMEIVARILKQRAAAGASGEKPKLPDECQRKINDRCEAYGQLRAAGRDEATAVRCAMSDCAHALDGVHFMTLFCACNKNVSTAAECHLELAIPPMLLPPEPLTPTQRR
ncbi:MAG: hypothetical protein HY075_13775 [Deltaproteobacteria bacterium]|nr:hypothetical protein [Deltaproteobacteria bacterium]